eukprot:CAMPEP_0203929286 /NCGR_PEP_ID=MMETSP0359-20131031/68238_1 /ASSEMBLY_ACC=CAM_ASM_000338 /TAXON_ID=268821 /ORGANISM="Scrippsiella Hangoei, Strain SHTV-5" /LENGTH=53 /DNA_ID=CAMNT_0050858293 /DNA_START=208 /DNA_END=366 /DNA_ORIENTATION=+
MASDTFSCKKLALREMHTSSGTFTSCLQEGGVRWPPHHLMFESSPAGPHFRTS